MRVCCNNINTNGVLISYAKLKAVTQKCESMKAQCLFKLYDMGYIPTPNKMDRVLFKALLQEFKGENVRDIVDYSSGQLDLSSKRVLLAYTRAKGSLKNVFKVLLQFSEAEETLKEIDILVNRRIVSERSSTKPFFNKVVVSTSDVVSRSNIMFNTKYSMDLVEIPEGCKIVKYDFSLIAYLKLCEYLGIKSDTINDYKAKNRGIFISDIPFTMEYQLVGLIITGSFNCDGDYGKVLNDSVSNYYYKDFSDDEKVYASDRYDVKVMSLSFNDRCKAVENLRKKEETNSFKEITMSNTSVTYTVIDKDSDGVNRVDVSAIHVGNYVINWSTCTELSKVNHIKGVCGEYISASDCRKNKYKTTGLPITLSDLSYSDGTVTEVKSDYYLISQVTTKEGVALEPKLGDTLHIEFSDFSKVLQIAKVDSEDKFFDLIVNAFKPKAYVNYSMVKYTGLVAELIIALLKMDSGVLDYKMKRQDGLKVPESIFIQACYDAERYFNSYLSLLEK